LMYQYMAGNKSGRRRRAGEQYLEEFRIRFWESSPKYYFLDGTIQKRHLMWFIIQTLPQDVLKKGAVTVLRHQLMINAKCESLWIFRRSKGE
ncbi:5033_t:CDS:2, partial [Acaulospora morrowiae]